MIRVICFAIVLVIVSCKAQKEVKPMGQEIEGLALIEQDDIGPVHTYETRLITDTKSLRKFYSEVNKTRKPGLPVPVVNFSKNVLVLVCLGEQKGVQTVWLSNIGETENELVLAVQHRAVSSKGKTEVQPITYPFYLYKMPLIDKTISFQNVEN